MLGSSRSCEAVEWVVSNIQHNKCPPDRFFLFVLPVNIRSNSKWLTREFLYILAFWKREQSSSTPYPAQGKQSIKAAVFCINVIKNLKGRYAR